MIGAPIKRVSLSLMLVLCFDTLHFIPSPSHVFDFAFLMRVLGISPVSRGFDIPNFSSCFFICLVRYSPQSSVSWHRLHASSFSSGI